MADSKDSFKLFSKRASAWPWTLPLWCPLYVSPLSAFVPSLSMGSFSTISCPFVRDSLAITCLVFRSLKVFALFSLSTHSISMPLSTWLSTIPDNLWVVVWLIALNSLGKSSWKRSRAWVYFITLNIALVNNKECYGGSTWIGELVCCLSSSSSSRITVVLSFGTEEELSSCFKLLERQVSARVIPSVPLLLHLMIRSPLWFFWLSVHCSWRSAFFLDRRAFLLKNRMKSLGKKRKKNKAIKPCE